MELGEGGALVGRVLERVDAHQRVCRAVGETGLFERPQLKGRARGKLDALGAAHRCGQTGCGGVDADERGAGLLGDPQTWSTGPAPDIDENAAVRELEKFDETAAFVEGEEPDVGELLGELASIGVGAPDVAEHLAPRESLEDSVVAVEHRLEDASVGHVVAEVGGDVAGVVHPCFLHVGCGKRC